MLPEVEKYPSQLDILINFAEGRLDGTDLDAALATDEMKALLSVFENPRYPATTNHFGRLNRGNRTSLGGLVNSEGIIEDFLKKAEVSFLSVNRYGNILSLILKAVPKYLDPSMELIEKIVPLDSALSNTQKTKLIKERLKKDFRYLNKPPKWIQGPEWPFRDEHPLIFVGQVDVDAPDLFHDSGAVYVFLDPSDGAFETVSQFY